jgi:formiminotetrahydrofolate cyclodeaminase
MSQGGDDRLASLEALLSASEEEAELPGVGASAALVIVVVARLIEDLALSARGRWEEAGSVITQAGELRRRALRLARETAEAHAAARRALDAVRWDRPEAERKSADDRLGRALAAAADRPLDIATTAADAAELAAATSEHGPRDSRPDAAGATMLAAGAADAAAHLVEVNLATRAGDKRIGRARRLASEARSASERALTTSG